MDDTVKEPFLTTMNPITPTCKYCNELEDKQTRPGLICENCVCFVHLSCLRRPGTPGDFVCDVFFDFTCEDCSPDKKEVFLRNKFPWINVIYLTLNHLSTQSYGISHYGYFHFKTHLCSFIDRYWQSLFRTGFKQKKNWTGTIAGVLSVYSKLFFRSGTAALGENGWWRLLHNFSPAVAAHIIQELARDKPKYRMKKMLTWDKKLFEEKIEEMGYTLSNIEEEPEPGVEAPEPATEAPPVPLKKRRIDSDELSGISGTSYYDHLDSDGRGEIAEDGAYSEDFKPLLADGGFPDVDFKGFPFMPSTSTMPAQSDSSSVHSPQPQFDSDCPSGSEDKRPEPSAPRPDSLFSALPDSCDLPWREAPPTPDKDLVEMTQYQEVQLLKQVEGLIPRVKDPNKKAYLHRLKAKLALRRLKRHKHLPLFDLDKTVKVLGGYVTEDAGAAANVERVLDRFQRSYLLDNLSGTVATPAGGTLLVSGGPPAPLRSPYSGATLKPYVRRDRRASPAWLRLMDELLVRTHRHIPGYKPPAHAPLDYSYVRPHHLPAVNSLCAQHFWPGIDLSEALQYPEHSCVVTYKKLVVGCAFLVPDASHHEAYISFVLTRPEWRAAGVGSFMLYHLLQTCTGKDVTLHVSPTNPAIFLYQKFGFKVEEIIQDFYEKYYDIDYKGCRHAVFLRLVR